MRDQTGSPIRGRYTWQRGRGQQLPSTSRGPCRGLLLAVSGPALAGHSRMCLDERRELLQRRLQSCHVIFRSNASRHILAAYGHERAALCWLENPGYSHFTRERRVVAIERDRLLDTFAGDQLDEAPLHFIRIRRRLSRRRVLSLGVSEPHAIAAPIAEGKREHAS